MLLDERPQFGGRIRAVGEPALTQQPVEPFGISVGRRALRPAAEGCCGHRLVALGKLPMILNRAPSSSGPSQARSSTGC